MEVLNALIHNKMVLAPIFGWASAQIIKTLVNLIMTKELSFERLFGSGGMPSSHSSTVVSLAFATGYCKGVDGFEFPMALVFAFIVMYDAMNVRQETGKQAVILNLFLKNEDIMKNMQDTDKSKWAQMILKEYVGHTPTQVLGGILLGILVGYLTCTCI